MWTVRAKLKRVQVGIIIVSGLAAIPVIGSATNLATFCPCPKDLPDAKLKGNGLIFF